MSLVKDEKGRVIVPTRDINNKFEPKVSKATICTRENSKVFMSQKYNEDKGETVYLEIEVPFDNPEKIGYFVQYGTDSAQHLVSTSTYNCEAFRKTLIEYGFSETSIIRILGVRDELVAQVKEKIEANNSTDNSTNSKKAQIVKLKQSAKMPMRASAYAAGYDVFACLEGCLDYGQTSMGIAPGQTRKIGTGLAIKPPEGYFVAIFPRSGLAVKQGLRLANCVGVVDEDYTGEYIIAIYNDSATPKIINDGDRIAQIVFMPYQTVDFEEVEKLPETERSSGGFGSTGIQ